MNYRSINDMNAAIARNMYRLPRDLDLIVGVPRSGLIAANLLALMGNVRLTDVAGYIDGRIYDTGTTKTHSLRETRPGPRKVLVLDDSISTGAAMATTRRRIAAAELSDEVIFAAVFGQRPNEPGVDLVFEVVPQPRIFQWNFMHHVALERACVGIDGVLCHDPTEEENDDGSAYLAFLADARPLYAPSRTIGTLVTSRLEKYRPQTEAWLARTGLKYERLVMLDLPSKSERQRLGVHGRFKGDYYRTSPADLFIESSNAQAHTIARVSGKPVLCLETHCMIDPSLGAILNSLPEAALAGQGTVAIKRAVRSMLGNRLYQSLKSHRMVR